MKYIDQLINYFKFPYYPAIDTETRVMFCFIALLFLALGIIFLWMIFNTIDSAKTIDSRRKGKVISKGHKGSYSSTSLIPIGPGMLIPSITNHPESWSILVRDSEDQEEYQIPVTWEYFESITQVHTEVEFIVKRGWITKDIVEIKIAD